MKTKLFGIIRWGLADAADLDHKNLAERLANISAAVDLLQRVITDNARKTGRKIARKIAEARETAAVEKCNTSSETDSPTEPGGWLDQLIGPENLSKWADPYVRRLGMLEHCDEILALHRAEAVEKAKGSKGAVEPALERELADLWCILEMHRRASEEFNGLCEERAWKFRP